MTKKILTFFLMAVTSTFAIAQVKGPERIIGTYTGEQKKELANGKGTSVGKDSYDGEFNKGYPTTGIYIFGEDCEIMGVKYAKDDKYEGEFSDGLFDGKGKLTFQDKAKAAIEGYWKKGKYAGRTKFGYEVIKKSNISRVVVQKNGSAPNKISIQGLSDVIELGTRNIEFNSTDGMYNDLSDTKFPFIINVKGTVPSNSSKAELQVLIENPGDWTIIVYTNKNPHD